MSLGVSRLGNSFLRLTDLKLDSCRLLSSCRSRPSSRLYNSELLARSKISTLLLHSCSRSKASYTPINIMPLSDEQAKAACVPPPPETDGFFFQQTMLRIKEPKRSLDFYSRVMGMTLMLKLDFPAMDFTLYFMGYDKPENIPTDPKEAARYCFSQKATLELTHNWGTENEKEEVYHNGNKDPRGFGHIGVVVPDVYKSCERFESLGVPFIKKPDAGKMKGLAFIQDPDGYWIEILNPTNMA